MAALRAPPSPWLWATARPPTHSALGYTPALVAERPRPHPSPREPGAREHRGPVPGHQEGRRSPGCMDTESPVASLPLSRPHCLGSVQPLGACPRLPGVPESGPSASPSPPDLDPLGWGASRQR